MSAINTGLIGYGFSGSTFHAPFLKNMPQFHLKKVMSANEEKVKSDIPDTTVVGKLEEVLDDHDVELVIITTPNHLHFDMIKKCLVAGKHVVVEKPFVVTSAEGIELCNLAKEKGRMLSIFHNRRWDADFLTIQSLLEHEELGNLYSYEAHFDRFRPQVKDRWKENAIAGSGVLYDLGSHLIDQTLQLFGFPDWVSADVDAQRDPEKAEDYFHIVLGYGQMKVILHSSSIVPDQGPRFQLHGDRGSFVKFGMDGQEDALKAGGNPIAADWGKEDPDLYGRLSKMNSSGKLETRTLPSEQGDYKQYYLGVHRSIREGVRPPVTAEEALNVIRLIEACKASSDNKQTIIFEG
ncbi:oxidoreductase [Falsibacillus albus]|uniref:Oxidoreductase n=1 Tax=Falsibacillus albus TaxID=2478915 RepID=A0A3L7K3J4_9BACI|nr:oxidoreductase [Falsibacillus albus]RLQ96581.1 oxidoreductase [Falsibacillus albus]